MVKFSPQTFWWVALGSVIGASLRSWLDVVSSGVFIPNVAGSLVLGMGAALMASTSHEPRAAHRLIGLTTGFCGSLTSFSAVMVGIAQRLPGRHQEVADTAGLTSSLVELVAMVVCGLVAITVGRWLGRTLATPT